MSQNSSTEWGDGTDGPTHTVYSTDGSSDYYIVNDWAINTNTDMFVATYHIHRLHPEAEPEPGYTDEGLQYYSVKNGSCWSCGETMPKGVAFLTKTRGLLREKTGA